MKNQTTAKKSEARARAKEHKKIHQPVSFKNKRAGQLNAVKAKQPTYKSGFDSSGKRIDFSNPKTPRGIISSLD